MNSQIQKPNFYKFQEDPPINTRESYNKLIASWKRAVAEDRLNNHSIFAELIIFRNLMLGDDPFKGFTPSHHINKNSNGRLFISGWMYPYNNIRRSLSLATKGKYGRVTYLSTFLFRIIYESEIYISANNLLRQMEDLSHSNHKIILYLHKTNDFFAETLKQADSDENGSTRKRYTYAEIFNITDGKYTYNTIPETELGLCID